MMSKLTLAVLLATAALWVEERHRIVIEPDMRPALATVSCPDNDNVPYTAGCIAFLKGATTAGMRWRADAAPALEAQAPPTRAPGYGAACPDNENRPYGASCIAFLNGGSAGTDASSPRPR